MSSSAILPGPLETLKVFMQMTISEGFWPSLGHTLLRGLFGFLIAILASLIIGIPAGIYSGIDAFFSPILIIIRSTPVISIILLALIWFQVDRVPIFIGFLTMFPILTTNITQGIKSIDRGLFEMAKVYQVPGKRILREIYLPGIVPFIYSGLITATGFGWRAIIIGEVLSQPRYGIGSMMQQAQSYLLVSEVISWTLVAVIIGFIFEQLLKKGKKGWIKWDTND